MSRLTEEQVNRAYRLFYGDGMNLGQVMRELGCGLYDLSPWLAAPGMRIAETAARETREQAITAAAEIALSASYGPPSMWPGEFPRGWRHPPGWPADRRPTPEEACWHDNGVSDARIALRASLQPKDTTDV